MKIDYLQFVRWSNKDKVYIGYCPNLFIGGVCHGKDESNVYAELCDLVAKDVRSASPRCQPRGRVIS
jgi:hypothetical protein